MYCHSGESASASYVSLSQGHSYVTAVIHITVTTINHPRSQNLRRLKTLPPIKKRYQQFGIDLLQHDVASLAAFTHTTNLTVPLLLVLSETCSALTKYTRNRTSLFVMFAYCKLFWNIDCLLTRFYPRTVIQYDWFCLSSDVVCPSWGQICFLNALSKRAKIVCGASVLQTTLRPFFFISQLFAI